MNVRSVNKNLYVKSLRDNYYQTRLTILTVRIAKQTNLTPTLVLLTVGIAEQSNPILG